MTLRQSKALVLATKKAWGRPVVTRWNSTTAYKVVFQHPPIVEVDLGTETAQGRKFAKMFAATVINPAFYGRIALA